MKSLILENIDKDELKAIIGEIIDERMIAEKGKTDIQVEYITRKEVSALLKISLPSLNTYTKNGKLKGYRIHGRVLYRKDEIVAALEKMDTLKYKRI